MLRQNLEVVATRYHRSDNLERNEALRILAGATPDATLSVSTTPASPLKGSTSGAGQQPLRSSAGTPSGATFPLGNITREVTIQELLANDQLVPGLRGAYLRPGNVGRNRTGIRYEDISQLTINHNGAAFMLARETVRVAGGRQISARYRIYSGTPDQITLPALRRRGPRGKSSWSELLDIHTRFRFPSLRTGIIPPGPTYSISRGFGQIGRPSMACTPSRSESSSDCLVIQPSPTDCNLLMGMPCSRSSQGKSRMSATHAQILARLGSLGVPLENMFLLPSESGDEGLIALWYPEIGLRLLILENESLAKACYKHLLDRGNRIFDSCEQLRRTAAKERWPGWDTCEPFIQEQHEGAST